MAKTKEELNALKEEAETVNGKLHELTDEELAKVSGGRTAESGDWYEIFNMGNGTYMVHIIGFSDIKIFTDFSEAQKYVNQYDYLMS